MTRLFRPAALLGAASLVVAIAACSSEPRADADTTATAADSAAISPPAAGEAATGAMLDPDAATKEQLTAIPGVSAQLADAIIAGRPYQNMLAVDKVLAAQLSEQQRDTVYTRLWKPIDLNTASGDEIMLIPGVGQRMKHEFEEYRPYRTIEQFRREIGKYVDDAEVARLEKYVTIR
ncbi:MAG TPA: hypothetical protein VFS05_00440 [Gemmatimonadaceae bacterium]|nr:hypothetical protein [Gemmatimonadaceae bacterium]